MRGGSSVGDTPRMVRLYGRLPTDHTAPSGLRGYPFTNGFRCVAERDEPIEEPEE